MPVGTPNDKNPLIVKGYKAAQALAAYLKVNKLSPDKDWTKHPEHGPIIKKYQKRIRIAEELAVKEIADTKAEKAANAKDLKKPKPAKVRTVVGQATAYDYPKVDGQAMTSLQKKKYRAKMRTLVKSGVKEAEATKQAIALVKGLPSEPSTKATKVKEPKKVEKKVKKEKTSKKPIKTIKSSKVNKKPKRVED